ncbi:MAG TPA: leucyl aminopeptidase family protein, partial [Alphaproteobacteria bacterium]|nr:leucyl aminopeptidase family protein [Alphaproteobacteria bacterium]
IKWGKAGPKITLVGKGVCFDSGGLDLKPASGMLLMKKDMGGGAHALALARMVMDAGLPVRLRVLVPAVENMVSGNSFKPLDVLRTRKGITVEVGNTDAEGRLILCDALAEADSEGPELLIDFATLTGAARVALGPDLPALFSNHDATAEAFLAAGLAESDPVWRMPLHQPYAKLLRSTVADVNNVSEGPYGGAITAALFLEKFVSKATPWVHLDVFAWNTGDRPGRPKGGEAMALRAAFAVVADKFGR